MSKELLFSVTKKDLVFDWFSGKGAGGQCRNKNQNCLRLYHPDSGVRTTGQSNRDRVSNQREAFLNLVNHIDFKIWRIKKTNEMLSKQTVEQMVDESMAEDNIKIECKDEKGRWCNIKFEDLK